MSDQTDNNRPRKTPDIRILTPWGRIAWACERGRGLRLTAEQVRQLMMDSAIDDRGTTDLEIACGGEDLLNDGPGLGDRLR